MPALIVVQELFLNIGHFKAWRELLIKGCSQKLDPVLEFLSIGQLLHIFFLNEGKPVDLGYTMIVVIVAFLDFGSRVSLDLAVDEIFTITFLDPLHLFQYAIKEVIGELMLISDVVSLIIYKGINVEVGLRANEL